MATDTARANGVAATAKADEEKANSLAAQAQDAQTKADAKMAQATSQSDAAASALARVEATQAHINGPRRPPLCRGSMPTASCCPTSEPATPHLRIAALLPARTPPSEVFSPLRPPSWYW